LSSQFVISGQPESPPKLYPSIPPTNPCAFAGAALEMEINSVSARTDIDVLAVGDIVSITS
jgi:hypothetical protein